MHVTVQDFLQIDLPALMAAVLACAACALVGNFLVLRRQGLMGDAVSHAVLPGIVGGFLLVGSRDALPMMAGALVSAALAGVLIEAIRRLGRLESGAAMGVVFTLFFAAGVVLIEQGPARAVDLDADCVLYGQLETILWLAPTRWSSLLDPAVWAQMPRQVVALAAVFAVVLAAVLLFRKELTIAAFDPGLAGALGLRPGLFHHGILLLTAATAIAAFEAVGSILVVAMLIEPITPSGPNGWSNPSVVSTPPPSSENAAMVPQGRPGLSPSISKNPLVPSSPGPLNHPNAFCEP